MVEGKEVGRGGRKGGNGGGGILHKTEATRCLLETIKSHNDSLQVAG